MVLKGYLIGLASYIFNQISSYLPDCDLLATLHVTNLPQMAQKYALSYTGIMYYDSVHSM